MLLLCVSYKNKIQKKKSTPPSFSSPERERKKERKKESASVRARAKEREGEREGERARKKERVRRHEGQIIDE